MRGHPRAPVEIALDLGLLLLGEIHAISLTSPRVSGEV